MFKCMLFIEFFIHNVFYACCLIICLKFRYSVTTYQLIIYLTKSVIHFSILFKYFVFAFLSYVLNML